MRRHEPLLKAYRALGRVTQRIPVVSWLFAWINPLHIAERSLYQAIHARAHYTRGQLLDVGCGSKPYANLFPHVPRYIGLDITANEVVDVVGTGLSLPFRDGCFETVLCNETLEHVPEPWMLMPEIFRVLKPGGYLLLTTPQTWGLHREPADYYRYTIYGLSYLAQKSGFEVVEVAPTCGLWATVVQRIADTVIFTYASRAPTWVWGLLAVLLAPIQLLGAGLDAVVGKRGDTLDNILVARRPL